MTPLRSAAHLALAALLLASAPVAAQDLQVGVQAGVNLSDVALEPSAGLEPASTSGLRLGGVVRVGLGPVLGLESGLHYARKGARIGPVVAGPDAFPGPAVPFNGELDLAHLDVPLLLAAEVPSSGAVSPRIFAGGQLSFETGCTVTVFGTSSPCRESGPKTVSPAAALVVGGGVDVAAGPGEIVVEARYEHGLTDVVDDPEIAEADTEQTIRDLGLSAGYVLSVP